MQISDPASNFFLLDDRIARGDEGPSLYQEECKADHDAWAHELQLERQQLALDALYRCKCHGALSEDLDTLARELGLSQEWSYWQLKDRDE